MAWTTSIESPCSTASYPNLKSKFKCPCCYQSFNFCCMATTWKLLRECCNGWTLWISDDHTNAWHILWIKSGTIIVDFIQIKRRRLPGSTRMLLLRVLLWWVCRRLGCTVLVVPDCWELSNVLEHAAGLIQSDLVSLHPNRSGRHREECRAALLLHYPR